jgi:hypothetical protein
MGAFLGVVFIVGRFSFISLIVIPAKAGIQAALKLGLDPRFRGDDTKKEV